MKVKAVIWRQDRTNDVVIVKKKNIEGNSFRHDNTTYYINPDASQITWTRPNKYFGIIREYFTTYYYIRGLSTPFPVADMSEFLMNQHKNSKNGFVPIVDEKETAALKGKPGAKSVVYKNVVNMGMSAEEVAMIHEPWFYRQLAAKAMSTWEQIQLFATIGAALGAFYIIYMLSTGHYHVPPVPPVPTPTPTPVPTAGA